jgi:hypothetical protein
MQEQRREKGAVIHRDLDNRRVFLIPMGFTGFDQQQCDSVGPWQHNTSNQDLVLPDIVARAVHRLVAVESPRITAPDSRLIELLPHGSGARGSNKTSAGRVGKGRRGDPKPPERRCTDIVNAKQTWKKGGL